MRDLAVFRFSPTEGPGHLADWLDAAGLRWRLFAIDEGAPVPADPGQFAGIAMMGGPMSVNDPLGWVDPLCALLRGAVAVQVPILGHCLGGQLLARAMGGTVGRAAASEIGWLDVTVAATRAARDWFGAREAFTTFQWHYEAFTLPPGAQHVLANGWNTNQGFVLDDRHIGLQCHVEVTADLVGDWVAGGPAELPERTSDATQAAADILADLKRRIAELNAVANDVYARWARGLRR